MTRKNLKVLAKELYLIMFKYKDFFLYNHCMKIILDSFIYYLLFSIYLKIIESC